MIRTAPTSPCPAGSPTISVLMSVYNGEPFLRESVESVLNQTLDDFEFIVVDDGSSDGSWAVLQCYAARDPRIRLFRNHANIGLTASLNRGLEQATGKYVARQDSDDVSLPCRFQEQVALLEGDNSLVLVGSACHVIDQQGELLRTDRYPETDTAIRWRMLFDNGFIHSSIMMRRQTLVANCLRYDERWRFAQDYELWSRLLAFGSGVNGSQPLIRYRVHNKSLGLLFSESQEKLASEVARSNIRALGSDASLEVLRTLKTWERDQVVHADAHFPEAFRLLLTLLDLFAGRHGGDRQGVREIRSTWMVRVLLGFPFSQLTDPRYVHLFLKTLVLDPVGFCRKFIGYCRRRLNGSGVPSKATA